MIVAGPRCRYAQPSVFTFIKLCANDSSLLQSSAAHTAEMLLVAAYIYKLNKTAPSASGCSSETLRVASFPALVVIRCRRPAMTQVIVLDESEQRSAYPPLRRAFVLRRATPQTSPQRIVITLCFISSFPAFHVSLRHPEVTPN